MRRGTDHSRLSSSPFRRVRFELDGDAALRGLVPPDPVSWRRAEGAELVGLLARALEASADPRDQMYVSAFGSLKAAAAMVEEASSGHLYESDESWWSVIEYESVPAGFVLPVVFTGCARGGRDEGTVYHIGVVPEQRGRGLGSLLLAHATDALLNHGVWQITADTAVENSAMIRLFEGQGWRRLSPVDAEEHPLPGLGARAERSRPGP